MSKMPIILTIKELKMPESHMLPKPRTSIECSRSVKFKSL